MKECDHIIGQEDEYGMLINKSNKIKWPINTKFKYCPLCGERLEDETKENT